MIDKNGSGRRTSCFFYKTRRKIRFLQFHGTLFHKTPRKDRLKKRSVEHLKRSAKRHKNIGHFFLYIRFRTLKRFNLIQEIKIRKFKAEPAWMNKMPANPEIQNIVPVIHPKYTLSLRIQRLIRVSKLMRLKKRIRKQTFKLGRIKKKQIAWRKLRYLYHTGKLFKFNYRALYDSMNRNYSFLGKGKFLVILINSTFVFLLTYIIVFLTEETASALTARTFNIKSVILYNDVEYFIRSREWTADSVQVVFSAGPLVSILLTIISLIFFALSSHERWFARLFVLWFALHAFTQSFGEIIFGALLNQDFGWVLDYLYYTDTSKIVLVSGFLMIMIIGGLFLSRFLLLTGNIYFNFLGKGNRWQFLMSQVFLPFIIGTGIIIAIKQPHMNGFDLIVETSMIIILLPAMLRARLSQTIYFDEEPRIIRIRWIWIMITIVTLIIFRILFWHGIRVLNRL
jgi:hypothetical protein